MGTKTGIEWTDHTFNPWIGCTKVSPGCTNCYAASQNAFRKWNGGTWGPGAPRKETSEANWHQPLLWARQAKAEGKRHKVFCASLADVFDQAFGICRSPRCAVCCSCLRRNGGRSAGLTSSGGPHETAKV